MNIATLLKQQLEKVKPSTSELKYINTETKNLIVQLQAKLKKSKISADIFVGGSSAKDTLIKKKKYDIDIFIRFDPKYSDQKLQQLIKKVIPSNAKQIHGSRDYFSLKKADVEFEIVPVLKISSPTQAKNITDLSYFHVNYIKKYINKHKTLADQIRLAKAFTYYQDCYGAESYINGFSGYALELLLIQYKTFQAFIKAMSKPRDGQEVIDIAKLYKNKAQIKQQLNKAKLQSPLILIDPTYKKRNALAALSPDTFKTFQKACKKFTNRPSAAFFELKDKQQTLKNKYKDSLIEVQITTNKQPGDIAGTKLKKFHNYFIRELEKQFAVKVADFDYNEGKNTGVMFIVADPKDQIIIKGPPIKIKKAAQQFKKHHKQTQTKVGRIYAIEKPNITFAQFLKQFKQKKAKTIKEMSARFK